jgi:hypothetical protein
MQRPFGSGLPDYTSRQHIGVRVADELRSTIGVRPECDVPASLMLGEPFGNKFVAGRRELTDRRNITQM